MFLLCREIDGLIVSLQTAAEVQHTGVPSGIGTRSVRMRTEVKAPLQVITTTFLNYGGKDYNLLYTHLSSNQ